MNCIVGIKPLKILLPVYPHDTAFKNVIALNYFITLEHRNEEWLRFSVHLPAKTSRVAIYKCKVTSLFKFLHAYVLKAGLWIERYWAHLFHNAGRWPGSFLSHDMMTRFISLKQVKNKPGKCLQYGTFELRIRSEFYCPNDVIVGHISLPHYKETVKSMFISRLL